MFGNMRTICSTTIKEQITWRLGGILSCRGVGVGVKVGLGRKVGVGMRVGEGIAVGVGLGGITTPSCARASTTVCKSCCVWVIWSCKAAVAAVSVGEGVGVGVGVSA